MSAQRASQLVEAGLWLRLSGDHEGAKRLFEQALKLDPTNARARQLLDSAPPAQAAPGAATKTTMDIDWGMATGHTPTPPPLPPDPPPPAASSPAPPIDTHTVRLGESLAAELPEVPRFEVPQFEDPHQEVMITGGDEPLTDSSTLVFGMSGVPAPPAAPSYPEPSSTLVFGSEVRQKSAPSPVREEPPGSTPAYGSHAVASSAAETGSSTLVFGGSNIAPSIPPLVDPGAAGSPQTSADPPAFASSHQTLVFGRSPNASVPPGVPGRTNTLVFAAAPPIDSAPVGHQTLTFGSTPPAIPPVVTSPSPREEAVVTEPGIPTFEIDDSTVPVPSPELEFNFDDMVTQAAPSAPPAPAPPEDPPQTAWDRSNPRIDITPINQGEGGGFDLITVQPPPKPRSPAQLKEEVATLLSGAKDLLDLDDHTGAIELISKALELDPGDPGALKLKERSERTLQTMYESKLGDLTQTPRVKLKDDEIIWLNLDHRAGFVLAQIDGSVTFDDLFEVSGMSRLDTARILAQLVEEGVIAPA